MCKDISSSVIFQISFPLKMLKLPKLVGSSLLFGINPNFYSVLFIFADAQRLDSLFLIIPLHVRMSFNI